MTRMHVDYAAARAEAKLPPGIDVTTPVVGFYRFRPHGAAVRGGVRVFYGPPRDPHTGEEMDRSWRWQAEFDGEYIDFERVWPVCAGDPISEADYRTYCARKRWAEQHAPESAYADRTKRIDPLSTETPLPF